MTSKQISSYITELGYKMNLWNAFTKICFIKADAQVTYAPGENILFKFNSSTEQLEYTLGKYSGETFINKYNETSDYTPCGYCDFNDIIGIVRTLIYTSTDANEIPFN